MAGTPSPDPFQVALRAAITASGLPLDRIRHRLKLRDISVSVPTLSNWQSGRRRPERPESLRALAELERVLDLPPTALRSLLGPPRPRGRAAQTSGPRALAAAWGDAAGHLLSTVDTRSDENLVRLSHHDTVRVLANLVCVSTRQVLRARQSGVDRLVVVWDNSFARIIPRRHCRLGRVTSAAGLTVAELIFDRPLVRGETAIIEYGIESPEAGRVLRRFHLPTRDFVLEAVFDPAAPPVHCVRIDTKEPLLPSPAGSVHIVGLNITGDIGISWETAQR
jgi:transcriptional regulator with XRE-family HTH domain